jgi:hypothetical protein
MSVRAAIETHEGEPTAEENLVPNACDLPNLQPKKSATRASVTSASRTRLLVPILSSAESTGQRQNCLAGTRRELTPPRTGSQGRKRDTC